VSINAAATTAPQPDGIHVSRLSKSFRRRGDKNIVTAIDNVDLHVEPGEMVVLLGPSGCGKTTFLRSIAGLETPDSGDIWLENRQVFGEGRNVPTNERNVSMVFQSYALWPHMTVGQNVAFPLTAGGRHDMRKTEISKRVAYVLDVVGMPGLEKEYPNTLSGGQQQRVALARALVTDPAVVLFDEPLSNVDAKVRNELRSQIRIIHERAKFAGVYVTHDQAEALSLASRVAVFERGRCTQLDTPERVYKEPATRYVADFVGSSNIFDGTLHDRDIETFTARTPIGELPVQRSRGEGLSEGSAVSVIVRPEDIRIADGGGKGVTTGGGIPAEVLAVEYQGPLYMVSLRVRDELVRASIPKTQRAPAAGERVDLSVDLTGTKAVARG